MDVYDVDYLMWVVSEIFTLKMGRMFSTLSDSAEIIAIVFFLLFFNKFVLWNR